MMNEGIGLTRVIKSDGDRENETGKWVTWLRK